MNQLQVTLSLSTVEAAQRLLGCYLVRQIGGQKIVAKIVETEAYDQTDAASHSYKGKTARTEVMFGPAGTLYVYFTYGMHYCCNIVVGEPGYGAAVLIRAVEPLENEQLMAQNRGGQTGKNSSNGPAKLCQALKINKDLNGHDLAQEPLQLQLSKPVAEEQIVRTTRIGISQAKDVPWRFYLKNNPYVLYL